MSGGEIRRRRTGDPEMDAMAVIADAVEPLEGDARKRVIKWADERFCEVLFKIQRERDKQAHESSMSAMDAYRRFMDELIETARKLNANPYALLKAAHYFSEKADELEEEEAA